MKTPGLRHSAEQVGGLVFFGRMLDKIRLHAQGKLPPDYKHGAGTDLRVCRFLHVEYPAVVERVLAGATDDEGLQWCFAQGRKPGEEEAFMFNAFRSWSEYWLARRTMRFCNGVLRRGESRARRRHSCSTRS